jgi:hypothetical protein
MLKNEPPFIPSGHENMLHLPALHLPFSTQKHCRLSFLHCDGAPAQAASAGQGQKMQT